MKNKKKIRDYWGFYFFFKNIETAKRFVELYDDVCYEIYIVEDRSWVDEWFVVKVVCGKGVIPMIKKAFGKSLKTERRRYYISE